MFCGGERNKFIEIKANGINSFGHFVWLFVNDKESLFFIFEWFERPTPDSVVSVNIIKRKEIRTRNRHRLDRNKKQTGLFQFQRIRHKKISMNALPYRNS